jgi:tetratricopeptide (TPR) repeat protein
MKTILAIALLASLIIFSLNLKAQQYNINDALLIDMYQNQHYADAAEYLKQNCPEPITNKKILSRFAYTYQMAGKPLDAEKYYVRIYNQDTTNLPVLLNLALINVNRENKPKAIYYYEKALVADRNNFQVYKQLGRLYMDKRDTLNASKNLLKANILNPDDPDVACDLSCILTNAKKIKQAEVVLVRALAADSTNLFLLRSVVNLMYTSNRFKETVSTCNKLIELGDQSVQVVNKLGSSYYMMKNYECCIESFALMPDAYQTERTYYLTAMSYKGLKRYKDALYNLDRTLTQAISPYMDVYYNEIAEIHDINKQYQTTAAAYQKSLFFKEHDVICYTLANLYDKNLKDKKNAIKYYQKYLNSKPPAKQQDYVLYVQSRLKALKK